MTRRVRRALLAGLLFAAAGCERARRADKAVEEAAPSLQPVAPTDRQAAQKAADSAYARGAYDSAQVMFMRLASDADRLHDTLLQSRATTQAGLAAWRGGRYPEARTLGERALAMKIAAGLTAELPKSYNALGLLAHHEGRFSQAIEAFTRSEEAAAAAGDSVALMKARGNRGLVHSDIGDFTRAREGFSALHAWAQKTNDTLLQGNALVNLGMVEIRAGAPAAALPLLGAALRFERAATFDVGIENAYGQLGTAYQAMGEPQLAIAYLDSALAVARANRLQQPETEDLQLLAECYSALGDHGRALELLARAAPIADSLGLRNVQGRIARAQAGERYALRDLPGARQRLEAARRYHADAGSTLEQLLDELAIAETGRRTGDAAGLAAERASLASARRLSSQIGSRVARIELALGEARVAEAANDPRGVLQALSRARADMRGTTIGNDWEAPALASRAYLSLGQLADAERSGREAVRLVEQVRARLAAAPLRTSFTAERSSVYGTLVVTLLRQGNASEAFRIADAARSRALLEHLSAVRGDSSARGATTDLAAAEQLLRRIDQLVELLRVADTAAPIKRNVADDQSGFLSRQLLDSRREYEQLMLRASAQRTQSVAIARGQLPDVARVRAALRPGEAMLEYFAAGTQLVTFVVSSRGVHALTTEIPEEALSSRIRLARDLTGQRESSAAIRHPVLSGLYELLIAPAERAGLLGGVRTLAIVPHSVLAYLPFSALIDPASGKYLIERYALFELPSGASLPVVRATAGEQSAVEATVFAPFPVELPGSRAEAVAIGLARRDVRQVVGSGATESALRASLARPGVVHVATHGVLNARAPMFSRVELSRPAIDRVATADDGRLEVHEVLGLRIQSPLVFLSGCETGSGPAWSTSFQRGDDYATLAEAFLYAGARNVISTLWRIEDRGAATFASNFYAALASGDPVDAMAVAQRRMLAQHEYAAPYYWAAYVVSGDGRPLGSQTRLAMSVP